MIAMIKRIKRIKKIYGGLRGDNKEAMPPPLNGATGYLLNE
tara:strand:- start:261 stop:383 length:123 start_codon:yes stop_codon:yes gene_type:complete